VEREIRFQTEDSSIHILGIWHVADLGSFYRQMSSLLRQHRGAVRSFVVHPDAILDVGIFYALYRTSREFSEEVAVTVKVVTTTEAHERIMGLVNDAMSKPDNSVIPKAFSLIETLGKNGVEIWNETISILSFVSGIVKEIILILVFPRRFRIKEVVSQVDTTGLNAIPICALVTFLIGIVITYLMGNQLRYYGANIFVVDGISVAMCRELSPILVAIIIAGRSGSAFAAQLGSMRLNQEVEALKVMGLSSYSVLIIPRIIALMITMPILVVVGNIFGILGGLCISYIHLDVSPDNFIDRLKMILPPKHIYVGLAKSPLFALFIASIGCRLGLGAAPNAVSIGQNTTKTVVQSIVSVILLNAAIAILLSHLGI
jgi:phospholipid/cholesterol/gamma-HCH transport system permease protein